MASNKEPVVLTNNYPNDDIEWKVKFQNEKPNGQAINLYENGKLDGLQTFFYENGNKQYEVNLIDDNGDNKL